jgi:hypothetical protein
VKFVNDIALDIGLEIGQLVAEKPDIGSEAARAALVEAAQRRGCSNDEIEKLVERGMRAIDDRR